jgi:acyl carrier protein
LDSSSIKSQIRQFVMENAQSKGVTTVSDTDSLTEIGVVDSLGIFRLVSFLEDSFGVRISDDEIVHDNFQTIAEIERFVSTKLAGKTVSK